MLKMRARSWTLRDGFADVLKGLHQREEAEDMPPIDTPFVEVESATLKDRVRKAAEQTAAPVEYETEQQVEETGEMPLGEADVSESGEPVAEAPAEETPARPRRKKCWKCGALTPVSELDKTGACILCSEE